MLKNRVTVLVAVLTMIFIATPAFAATGVSVFNSSGVTNPANVLSTDADYATFSASASACPTGFTRSGGVCTLFQNQVVYHVTGWELVDLTADDSATSVASVSVQSSDLCTSGGCSNYTNGHGTWVFGTANIHAATPTWIPLAFCALPNNAQFNDCTQTFLESQNIEGLLIGRSNSPSKYGTIGVHSVTYQ